MSLLLSDTYMINFNNVRVVFLKHCSDLITIRKYETSFDGFSSLGKYFFLHRLVFDKNCFSKSLSCSLK